MITCVKKLVISVKIHHVNCVKTKNWKTKKPEETENNTDSETNNNFKDISS